MCLVACVVQPCPPLSCCCPVASCLGVCFVLSWRVWSGYLLSCLMLLLSCLVISCPVSSCCCLVLLFSCLVVVVWSCLVVLCLVFSCLVFSYLLLSCFLGTSHQRSAVQAWPNTQPCTESTQARILSCLVLYHLVVVLSCLVVFLSCGCLVLSCCCCLVL